MLPDVMVLQDKLAVQAERIQYCQHVQGVRLLARHVLRLSLLTDALQISVYDGEECSMEDGRHP